MTSRRRLLDFASPAFTFVFTLGIVNLFADVTYEGGGSLNGPFLAALGATAAATNIVGLMVAFSTGAELSSIPVLVLASRARGAAGLRRT